MASSFVSMLLLCFGTVAAAVAFGSHAALVGQPHLGPAAHRLHVSALAGYWTGIAITRGFVLYSLTQPA